MRGEVRFVRGRWRLDERANFTSLVSNTVILDELVAFLENGGVGRETLLDLGAGSKPYARLYERYFDRCVSVDVPHSTHDTTGVDVMAAADSLPFDDEAFDCVICTEVLEHCPEPQRVMTEISRVLKPAGSAFLTTPFLLPLHEMPYDFYRYTPSALHHLAANATLRVQRLVPRGSYVSVALGINAMPVTKAMQKLASMTGLPLGHAYNPILYALVVAPQKAYLAALRGLARYPQSRLSAAHEKLTYYANGYVSVLQKSA